MRSCILTAVALALALIATPAAQQRSDLQAAADALRVAAIDTLQFTGAGQNFSVGQNYHPSEPWPPIAIKNYSASINYNTASMRVDMLREMGPIMPRGGGQVFSGEQRQIQVLSGDFAWNVPVPAANAPAGGAQAQPAAGTRTDRMMWLWTTPHGFVKAALANNATSRNVPRGTEVSFTIDGNRMTGTINSFGEVERVQTMTDHPVIGDMAVVTTFSGYRDFAGVMFPSRIVQTQDGFPSLDLVIWTVTANPGFEVTVPDNVRQPAPPAPPAAVTSMELARGVYLLGGGGAHSVAIEMRDHIVVVDVPTGEARAVAVLAKAKEVIPNKPIRFVVTSHHHWDHLSGIRAAIDEGVTIVTHESYRALLERVARTPHTLVPDRLSKSKRPLRIQTVGERAVLSDGSRTIELHREPLNRHASGFLLTYLPAEKILIQVDLFLVPVQPGQPLNRAAIPGARALYDTIRNLKLDVDTIVALHGNRTSTVAELAQLAAAGSTN